MASENKAVSITVIALGLFLELQVHILEQDEAEEVEEQGVKYSIIPYTKQDKSTLTIDHLEKILKFGSFELDRLVSDNGRYEVMARDVTVSQVLVSPATAITSSAGDEESNMSLVTARFAGCPLKERLYIQKFESSMQREQFEKLSRALGEEIVDITSALLAIHRIVTGDRGLEKLKEKLVSLSTNSLPTTNKERSTGGRSNIYLECVYLVHGLCDVRISLPPTSYRDYSHRLLGFILRYAGVSISPTSGNTATLGTFPLTTNKTNLNHLRQSTMNFAGKAMLNCTIYGPDVDVGEIAKSMMPMFVQDNLEPDCLLRLHPFTTQDSDEVAKVIGMLEKLCLELKEESLVFQEDDERLSMESIVQWLYSKCQHHKGERLLLYYYTMNGVAKLIRQYGIFASACSHLDEGLFTALSPNGKEQAILLQAQDLNIIPKHPLDDIIDKRIWKFIPHSDIPKENGDYYADEPDPDGHHASRLSFYHQFMTDLISLLPHTRHYDIDELKSEIQHIRTSNDHDSFWVNLKMTSMNKRSKRSIDMSCGDFQAHLCDVPMDMSFINAELFQFRLLFCSNSHACREMSFYTSNAAISQGIIGHALFQMDSKCKLCFKNALLCAVTIYQQLHIAFASLHTNIVTSSLKTDVSSKKRGRGSHTGASGPSKDGKTRCLIYLKNMVDEFLPAAVIRYLWGRKAITMPDDISLGIARLKLFPAQHFPWCDHRTCGDSVPPTVKCLLFYAKEIAKQKNIEKHTEKYEDMLRTLTANMFSCSADEKRIDVCVNAMIQFFDHITEFAIQSVNNKILEDIPTQWHKKLWPEESKKRKHENGDSSTENFTERGTKCIPGVAGALKDKNMTESKDNNCANTAHRNNLQGRSIKSRTLLTGQNFILSECERDHGCSHDSDDEEEDIDDDDRAHMDEENDGCDNEDDETERSWNSRDKRFQAISHLNTGVDVDATNNIRDDNKLDNYARTDAACPSYEYEGDSDDEVIPHIEFDLALQLASNYGGDVFANSMAGFLTTLAPFASCGVMSFKVTGDDVKHFHKLHDEMSQMNDLERKDRFITREEAMKDLITAKLDAAMRPNADMSAPELAKPDAAEADVVTPSHDGKRQSTLPFMHKSLDLSHGLEMRTKPSKTTSNACHLTSSQQSMKSPYAVTPATLDMLKKKKKK
mmetsp:Transcript_6906/g.13011  ORF Transcript_6906/g.13011 Transcript_6906/m.13011 type:complete len:1164 (-) Transcript_6906:4464-7955(-)